MNKSQQAGNSLKNTSHYNEKASRNHNKAIQN